MNKLISNKINGLIKRLQNLKSLNPSTLEDWMKVLGSLHDFHLAFNRLYYWCEEEFNCIVDYLTSYEEEVSNND